MSLLNQGWICPVCGRGLSPYINYCDCKKEDDLNKLLLRGKANWCTAEIDKSNNDRITKNTKGITPLPKKQKDKKELWIAVTKKPKNATGWIEYGVSNAFTRKDFLTENFGSGSIILPIYVDVED